MTTNEFTEKFMNLKAIEELMYLKHMVREESNADKALDRAIEALKQNRWIPCEERLPEVGKKCLLTIHEIDVGGKEYDTVHVGIYSNNYRNHITAWMPLPKPWEG